MGEGLQRRVLLEVFKFLEPEELLRTDLACRLWHRCSCEDEVWADHLLFPSLLPQKGLRLACIEQLLAPRFFAFISMSSMTVTDLLTLQTTRTTLRSPFQETFFGAWVSLPRKVMYCGGIRQSKYVSDCFLLGVRSGRAEKLPDMITNRAGGGLVYKAGRVYIFGGEREQNRSGVLGHLRASEKFIVASSEWTSVGEMLTPRRSFTPALWKDRVFLAGGGGASTLVEMFLLQTEKFQAAAFSLLCRDAPSISFAMGDSLVVLSHSSACEFSMTSGALTDTRNIKFEYWYSPGGAVACRGLSFFGVYYESQLFCIGRDLAVTPIAATN